MGEQRIGGVRPEFERSPDFPFSSKVGYDIFLGLMVNCPSTMGRGVEETQWVEGAITWGRERTGQRKSLWTSRRRRGVSGWGRGLAKVLVGGRKTSRVTERRGSGKGGGDERGLGRLLPESKRETSHHRRRQRRRRKGEFPFQKEKNEFTHTKPWTTRTRHRDLGKGRKIWWKTRINNPKIR